MENIHAYAHVRCPIPYLKDRASIEQSRLPLGEIIGSTSKDFKSHSPHTVPVARDRRAKVACVQASSPQIHIHIYISIGLAPNTVHLSVQGAMRTRRQHGAPTRQQRCRCYVRRYSADIQPVGQKCCTCACPSLSFVLLIISCSKDPNQITQLDLLCLFSLTKLLSFQVLM